jgi:hypothetical protein
MKVLFLDIETAPNLGYIWGKYEQNVLSYERERYMLCFSYLWAGESETKVVAQIDFKTAFKKDKFDDTRVLKECWKLLDEADVVIGHNVRAFDIKMIQGFFFQHGILPPSPYQTIDTLMVARKHFKLNSNSLKDLANLLGMEAKKDPGGFSTWLGCMAGDEAAWATMIDYARRDTELLEPLYERMLPWITAHPTMTMGAEGMVCPKCGSDDLMKRGVRRTKVSEFQTWCCGDCGSFSSERVADKTRPKPQLVGL